MKKRRKKMVWKKSVLYFGGWITSFSRQSGCRDSLTFECIFLVWRTRPKKSIFYSFWLTKWQKREHLWKNSVLWIKSSVCKIQCNCWKYSIYVYAQKTFIGATSEPLFFHVLLTFFFLNIFYCIVADRPGLQYWNLVGADHLSETKVGGAVKAGPLRKNNFFLS